VSTINTKDGTEIYRKEGGGQAVLGHGWPLNADVWDGYRWLIQQPVQEPGNPARRRTGPSAGERNA